MSLIPPLFRTPVGEYGRFKEHFHQKHYILKIVLHGTYDKLIKAAFKESFWFPEIIIGSFIVWPLRDSLQGGKLSRAR